MGGRLATLSTGRKVTYAALLLIVGQVVFRSYFIARSWFMVDDFYFLSDIAQGQDDPSWYFQVYQGHFMPFSFLLVRITASFGPFNWAPVAVCIIAMQFAASLACWWMLRSLFGNRPAILLPLGLFLFSPLTMPSVLWSAVAINQLPYQIACFGAIAAHVAYARSRQRRYIVPATAFLCLGFLSYEKTLLLPIILLALTMMYFSKGSFPRRCRDTAVTYWNAWAAYGVVAVTWLLNYLRGRVPSPGGNTSSFLDLAQTMTLESLATPLVGGPWRWSLFGAGPISYGAAPDLGIVAAAVVLSAVVFYLWSTRECSLRALWLIGIYVGASIVLVYLGRGLYLGLIGGVRVGQNVQYLADGAPVIVLAFGLMLTPILGATESAGRRVEPILTWLPPRTLVTVVLLIALGGAIFSTFAYAKPWNSNFAERSFTQTATKSILRDEPLFAHTQIPERILSPLTAPRNLIRNYFAPVGTSLHTTSIGNHLKMFREDGSVANAVLDGPSRTEVDPELSCQFEVSKEVRTIPIVPVFNYPFWMAIEYTSNMDATIPLEYGIYRKEVPIENGKHTLFLSTSGSYDSVTLRPLVGQEICVDNIKVGQLIAAAKP